VFSGLLVLVLVLVAPLSGEGASYPSKPVKVIVPTGAGGSHDMHARALSSVMHTYLGQPLLVQIMGGGGGKRGMTAMKRAKPDGYTLGMGSSAMMVAPHARDMGFDPLKDFIPVYSLNEDPTMWIVKGNSPWKTLDDIVEAARKNPGKISFGSSGAYRNSHLLMIAVEKAKGVKFNHIPFRGGGKAFQAMLGGHVDVAVANPATGGSLGRMRKGELRALGITTKKRDSRMPKVPTFLEQGVDFVYVGWRFFVVPTGTPKDRIMALDAAFRKAVKDKSFNRLVKKFGTKSMPIHYGPELTKKFHSVYTYNGSLFRKLGIKKKKKK